MKGLGTDEKGIISVLANRTSTQREQITCVYEALYRKSLLKRLDSELSGHFFQCVRALCIPQMEYLAGLLRKAMHGAGATQSILIDILCTQSNVEMNQLKKTYTQCESFLEFKTIMLP